MYALPGLWTRLRGYLHVVLQHNALVEPTDWHCESCLGGAYYN
jgi:hypothetical protein